MHGWLLLLFHPVLCLGTKALPSSVCRQLGGLHREALADLYVIDASSLIARTFYIYARCWLDPKRLRLFGENEDYRKFSKYKVEFVLSDLSMVQEVRNFYINKNFTVSVLLQCGNTSCVNGVNVEKIGPGIRGIRAHPSDFRDAYTVLVAGVSLRNETSRQQEKNDELTKLHYNQAIRVGGVFILVVCFCFLACVVCCHSVYVITLLYDDFEYRRHNMMEDGQDFHGVPAENFEGGFRPGSPPGIMRSPEVGLNTAMSRSRASLSSIGTDRTQTSRSARSNSLVFFD